MSGFLSSRGMIPALGAGYSQQLRRRGPWDDRSKEQDGMEKEYK